RGAPSGTSPGQTIRTPNPRLTNYVTFRPAPGVSPQFGCHVSLTQNWVRGTDTVLHVASIPACFGGQFSGLHLWNRSKSFSCTGSTTTPDPQLTGCVGGPGSDNGDTFGPPAQIWIDGLIQVSVPWVKLDGIRVEWLTLTSPVSHFRFTNGWVREFNLNGSDITFDHSTV